MKAADYIVDFLIKKGTTDAFGIPGGVILELLYAMKYRGKEFTPHLMYHEQSAGFAACGYAQSSGKLGVAYATRGPGFTNLITAIADAYYDSIPVLFITCHSTLKTDPRLRIVADQEMDTCGLVNGITNYSTRVDKLEDIPLKLSDAYRAAMIGRKGPVFLDIYAGLLTQSLCFSTKDNDENIYPEKADLKNYLDVIIQEINNSHRPVLLVGDGIHQTCVEMLFNQLVDNLNIPVLSSRYSHDLVNDKDKYFGYIGSHGNRFANFILSKADLIITLGNRLNFPFKSTSYKNIILKTKFVRVEQDISELYRQLPNSIDINMDVKFVVKQLLTETDRISVDDEWLTICRKIKLQLKGYDTNTGVLLLNNLFAHIPTSYYVVCDVGNNEFSVSLAAVESNLPNRTLYSKSFGALGCSLGKAIGCYYSTGNPVVAVVGDQGIQMNIQELQYIGQHHLPILIVLLNNESSGMIKDRETQSYEFYLHTTLDSGYANPNFKLIAEAYDVNYQMDFKAETMDTANFPLMLELKIKDGGILSPMLPKSNICQDMYPLLDREYYDYLNKL